MEPLQVYITHPEKLNRNTLYELRMLVAKYPTFDVARLLMLKNLYILHDVELGGEMRRAALYLKNRLALFEIIEGYGAGESKDPVASDVAVDRTMALIDAFLETLPEEPLSLEAEGAAAVDYVSAYLAKNDFKKDVPQLRGQSLIDDFLSGDNEKITLNLKSDGDGESVSPAVEASAVDDEACDGSFFTETLANIYIKQGKYEKALEIIKRLYLEYPNKNRYFADQIRFLEKIIKHTKRK